MSHLVSPLIHRIARDRRLTANDVRVWLSVAGVVGVDAYVAVKLSAIANATTVRRSTVADCLVRLVSLGYIERGERDGARGAVTYRLPREISLEVVGMPLAGQ